MDTMYAYQYIHIWYMYICSKCVLSLSLYFFSLYKYDKASIYMQPIHNASINHKYCAIHARCNNL